MSRDKVDFARLQKVAITEYKRMIAISDIHGNGHLLNRLLDEISFSKNDALFLLGDYIERGKNSLETVRCVMALCKEGNAFALQGNCDTLWDDLIRGRYNRDINSYIDWRKNSILADMCTELELDRKCLRANEVRETLEKNYGDIFEWLRNLPHIIETEKMIFVHAGIDEGSLSRQDAERCLKREAFLEEDHCFEKTVICGHMPLCNYFHLTGDRLSFHPLCEAKKNIVGIDGGNAVKTSGQLNAYIMEGANTNVRFTDDLPKALVVDNQEASACPSSVAWNHREVNLVEKHKNSSLCFVKYTGKFLEIPNKLLYMNNGEFCSEDYTNYRLALKPGDVVEVLKSGREDSLVKYDGVIGWARSIILTHR